MNYIYHAVPEQMVGDSLQPLNQMKQTNPKLYQKYAKKYVGREVIMERKIPLLDCLWNDAVQFLPVHPSKIFKLQYELGLITNMPDYKFYEISLDQLNPAKTVVFFKDGVGEENVRVEWLNDVDVQTLENIPSATANYYKSLIDTDDEPFNYQFIPHILRQGLLDVSDCKVVSTSVA